MPQRKRNRITGKERRREIWNKIFAKNQNHKTEINQWNQAWRTWNIFPHIKYEFFLLYTYPSYTFFRSMLNIYLYFFTALISICLCSFAFRFPHNHWINICTHARTHITFIHSLSPKPNSTSENSFCVSSLSVIRLHFWFWFPTSHHSHQHNIYICAESNRAKTNFKIWTQNMRKFTTLLYTFAAIVPRLFGFCFVFISSRAYF